MEVQEQEQTTDERLDAIEARLADIEEQLEQVLEIVRAPNTGSSYPYEQGMGYYVEPGYSEPWDD